MKNLKQHKKPIIICITGTPGTGKSTIANKLSESLNAIYLDGNKIIAKYNLNEGKDKERNCIIVDEKNFSDSCINECSDKDKIYIIDSHLSHHLPKDNVSLCIVCRCSLKELNKRLNKRGYNEQKVKDNLESETFEQLLEESIENYHNTTEFWAEKQSVEELVTMIKRMI